MKGPGILAFLLILCSQSWCGVVINEVLYDPLGPNDTGLERIELYNNGTGAVSLAGWELYPARTPYYRFTGFTLQPGAFAVVHLRESGTDTPTELYEGTGPTQNMSNTAGSVALFDSSSHSAATIKDYMEYGAGGQTWESAAGQDSLWTRGDFVPDAPEGYSIGLFPNGVDNNRSTDWREFRSPTIGKRNLFAPGLSNVKIVPDSLMANGSGTALLSVKVTDAGSGVGGAEADLTALGGDAHQSLYDDGTHGDQTAGDSVYSFSATAGSAGPGAKTLYVSASDSSLTAWSRDSVTLVVAGSAGGKGKISASPNPFSPDGDGVDDRTVVTAEIPGQSALARIYVYDVNGRLVRRLLDQVQIGSSQSVAWDGKNDQGETLGMGMYVLYLEAIDALGGQVVRAKGTVVLAKKLR